MSCDSLNQLKGSFTEASTAIKSTKTKKYSVKDPAWRFTQAYVDKIEALSKVDSWAYQKLASEAIQTNDLDKLKVYISQGINPNMGITNIDKQSLINRAIVKECRACIELMADKTDFNFSTKGTYRLPVLQAALHSTEMMRFLVENYNIDPNCYGRDPIGTYMVTALAKMTSLENKYYKSKNREAVIRYMLEKGARPQYGSVSSVYYYIHNMKEATVETIELFAEKGADFNYVHSGYARTTMLGYTIEKKRYDIAKALLKIGVDPNLCDRYNSVRTPINWAIRNNNLEMVKALMDHGAKDCTDFAKCEPYGSALDFAIEKKKDRAIVDYLIEQGAK